MTFWSSARPPPKQIYWQRAAAYRPTVLVTSTGSSCKARIPAFIRGMKFPRQVGVMVLPNAFLYPDTRMPLFIFEPRYRLMLSRALAGDRMFAVAHPDDDGQPQSVAGVGIVATCLKQDDGTSRLVLEGISRVQFSGFEQRDDYFLGEFEPLETKNDDEESTEAEANELKTWLVAQCALGRIDDPSGLAPFIAKIEHTEAAIDTIASVFLQTGQQKQAIMETLDLSERIHRLREFLEPGSSGGFGGIGSLDGPLAD